MKKILNIIFGKKKSNTDNAIAGFKKILNEINELIKNCKEEKEKAYKDIDQINNWAKEIILEVFKVPHKFWYEEFSKYEEIKKLGENINIDSSLTGKCENVLDRYKKQIKNREEKIKSCKLIMSEYQTIKKNIKKQINCRSDIKEQKNVTKFDSYNKKISKESMYDGNILSPEEKLFRINNDIKALEDELRFMQEFENETKNINDRF